MRQRFLTYLAHTDLRWKTEDERIELVDFAEQNLPALARRAGRECQDGELYSRLDSATWNGLTSDLLPQSTADEKLAMARTMEVLKFWQGFLGSKYRKMTDAKFAKELEKERKAAAKCKQTESQPTVDNSKPTAEDKDTEGALRQVNLTRRERSQDLRDKALEIFGYTCTVCKKSMKDLYGDIGEKFIEVHHLRPISCVEGEHEVDVANEETGMRPLCPNCHAMIHRAGTDMQHPMPLKEFIELYNSLNHG